MNCFATRLRCPALSAAAGPPCPRRPLRQSALPRPATGGGRALCPRRYPALGSNLSKQKNKDPPSRVGPYFWRRRRDLNPRAGFPAYSLSRGAPSASWVLLQVELRQFKKWRREWDSNPRPLAGSLVFKTSSLNHSDTSPYAHLAFQHFSKIYFNTSFSICQHLFLIFLNIQ